MYYFQLQTFKKPVRLFDRTGVNQSTTMFFIHTFFLTRT